MIDPSSADAELRWAAIRGAIDAGRLEEAAQLALTAQGEVRKRAVRAQLRLLQGAWSGLAEQIVDAQGEAIARERPVIFHTLSVHAEELALQRAASPLSPPSSSFAAPGPILAARRATLRARRGVRAGVSEPAAEAIAAEARRYANSACQGLLLEADLALAREREAARALDEAASQARRRDALIDEALLRELLVDACLLEGDVAPLERQAHRLDELARLTASRRFAAAAAWARALGGAAPAEAELRRLVDEAPEAHPAARRLRSLLGEVTTLDVLDRRVVAALGPRWRLLAGAAPLAPPPPAGAPCPLLTLDPVRRTVRVGEQEIDLSAKPLFLRILATIIRHGGFATKEQLALEAWEQPSYSPLRDDNRIQVAIGRLRRSLCLPSLLAHDDGYLLSGGAAPRKAAR